MSKKKGAGIIPFTKNNNSTDFLFHKTFTGRRAGLFVDFGGGSNFGESYQQTAVREFIEETEAMFFCENIKQEDRSISAQSSVLAKLLQETQQRHPDWWCARRRLKDQRLKDWKTFFVQVDYKDVAAMNKAWASDSSHQFVKRRELIWLDSSILVDIIDHKPEQLWKRVRELENLKSIVVKISTNK